MIFYKFLLIFLILSLTMDCSPSQKVILTKTDKEFLLQQLPKGHQLSYPMQAFLNQPQSTFVNDERCKRQYMLLQPDGLNPLQTLQTFQMNIPFFQQTVKPSLVLVAPQLVSGTEKVPHVNNVSQAIPTNNDSTRLPEVTQVSVVMTSTNKVSDQATTGEILLKSGFPHAQLVSELYPKQDQIPANFIAANGSTGYIPGFVNEASSKTIEFAGFSPDPGFEAFGTGIKTSLGFNFFESTAPIVSVIPDFALSEYRLRKYVKPSVCTEDEYQTFTKNVFGYNGIPTVQARFTQDNNALQTISEYQLTTIQSVNSTPIMQNSLVTSRSVDNSKLFPGNPPLSRSKLELDLYNKTFCDIEMANDNLGNTSTSPADLSQQSKLTSTSSNVTAFNDNMISSTLPADLTQQSKLTTTLSNVTAFNSNVIFSTLPADLSQQSKLSTTLNNVTAINSNVISSSSTLIPQTTINTIIPSTKEELKTVDNSTQLSQDAKLEKKLLSILENVESLKVKKPTVNEGMPCSHLGKWVSSMAGVGFHIEKVEGENFKVPQFRIDSDKGFLRACDWEVTASVPTFSSDILILTATKTEDFHMATFTGECRTCNSEDVITGHWLVVKAAVSCEELNRGQDFFGDTWKRLTESDKAKI